MDLYHHRQWNRHRVSGTSQAFQRFFRGNDQFQGHGLGLYLTHLSAQRLGGTIEFESTVGIGATFILRLPKSFPN
ncbi:MAG: ATP-binding protein [Salibacteraceae bacterium]